MQIKVDLRGVKQLFQKNTKVPRAILDDAYDFFVKTTPIDTGNARRNTNKDDINYKITADYPYAERLDKGWSKQAPDGMVQPTIDHVQRRVNYYANLNRGK